MKKILSFWLNLSMPVRASFAFMFSTIFLRGISFITTPIFTRLMDASQYGIISTYNAWLSIIEVFAVLGLTSAGVFNIGLNENKNQKDVYISSIIGLGNGTTLILFALIFATWKFLGTYYQLTPQFFVLMLIHFWFYPAQMYWLIKNRYDYQYRWPTIITILSTLLGQIFAVIAVVNSSKQQAFAKVSAQEIGSLLFSIPLYISAIYKGKKYFDKTEWLKALKLSFPLIPHYLAQHIMGASDKTMISAMVSTAATAIYSVVFNISMVGSLIWNAINSSLVPYTYKTLDEKNYKSLDKIAKYLLIGYAILCVGIMAIAPEVLAILAPPSYREGVYAVPPIACVCFFGALYNIYANIEFYHKKTGAISTATVISAISNLALNALLIPKFGYTGAAYATMLSNIVLLIMHYIGYRRCVEELIYDDRYVLAITAALLAISAVMPVLYRSDPLRYGVIAFSVVVVIVENKKLRGLAGNILKEMKAK